ncbi:MAG: MBL fold metallo-hydrolase [Candidatus Thiodiazotropha taylori]|nr:MBL fold metallo-hydrolase [Candidatus Thiodiazotropha taylori]MCG8029293.1 MBL fold metallo-hydrolase [Candidatus Thiodiazotropha taylori]MCG8082855.1 MBL fold metallo-hydrolase [Candidatus Thiodiazotropha taylori]MCG8109020.1 MBL fold metallo-hydrolase [Candidatus Thiodiazotropha taylori]MCG8111959.1 MBL fold metallo-hydrolase [Candidatus Thiodiazotropha taylori]
MNQLISKCLLLIFLFHSFSAFAERGAAIPDYAADEITKGVFVIHGPLGVPSVQNQGFINNPAFIVGEKGVLVIDPGSSVQIGEMVLRQIAKVSDLPVVAVFNTHIHGDHWFANQAFKEAYPEVLIFGHETMRKLVAIGEGKSFMQTLMRMTKGAVEGTVEVPPNRSAAHGEEMILAGVSIRIHYQAKAHSHSDIMLELPRQRVIFLGDNVMSKRLGQMDSATFRGNIEAIDMALATSAVLFVPGHGQTGGREVPLRYREYLSLLKSEVAKYYEEGMSDFEMSEAVSQSLAGFHDWVDFDRNVGRHISLAYLEVEAELF